MSENKHKNARFRNVIITSGGTTEPIDEIRRIVNIGKGTLGAKIADEFLEHSNGWRVLYVHSKGAVMPKNKNIETYEVTSCKDLVDIIQKLKIWYHIDAVIHSMAVSDYTIESVVALFDIATRCENGYYSTLNEDLALYDNILDIKKKIPSDIQHPCLILKPTPKVIASFRGLFPDATLIGFKLLDDVSQKVLIETAHTMLLRNELDYVLANDFNNIKNGSHIGYLVDKDGDEIRFEEKDKIADGIVKTVLNSKKGPAYDEKL